MDIQSDYILCPYLIIIRPIECAAAAAAAAIIIYIFCMVSPRFRRSLSFCGEANVQRRGEKRGEGLNFETWN